ncbi:uncharacterized protein MELLADRAFT_58364 [Melampsora larici-populina 98AG31]|uniref:Uncharacterized protein n=1 Tax=Melampsora larici-populina (strain 98AG31 / pathotype 3-4-7) TaxID=747676 RepID=F4R384_MELLP|nr:uncharacterized protein MELLADRAFT_58364 [Melampsora larici-populina 98AG31]EGG12584.1 hypothetical protein MELLADRAFT_58364 [Melampsora larici-populina 98AG31]
MTCHAIINAVVTSVAMKSGQMSWLKNRGTFTFVDTEGHTIPKPLETLGFVAPVNTLQADHIYSISGPFGQDSVTGRVSIKHTALNHIDVTDSNISNVALAGRATLTGVAKVVSFYLKDGPPNGPD